MSRLVTQLQSYYREEEGTYLIEIKLNQLQQVFNSLDPSPFLDRDLDDNAENYIINSVDEFPLNTPLKLVFYLPSNEQNTARHLLPSALHNYFDYRQQGEQTAPSIPDSLANNARFKAYSDSSRGILRSRANSLALRLVKTVIARSFGGDSRSEIAPLAAVSACRPAVACRVSKST